jgi:hypothetical protein
MSDPSNRPAPFSLRLTREERARLDHDRGDMPLGAYLRSCVLDATESRPRRRSKAPVKDHQALSRVLAVLGQSRIANNLNQIAKAAHFGALPIGPELEAELSEALAHIAAIRTALIEALNLSEGSS